MKNLLILLNLLIFLIYRRHNFEYCRETSMENMVELFSNSVKKLGQLSQESLSPILIINIISARIAVLSRRVANLEFKLTT